jgi:hypothetical protein
MTWFTTLCIYLLLTHSLIYLISYLPMYINTYIYISLSYNLLTYLFTYLHIVATPLWAKCEDETHTPKSGNLESSGTPKNSELDCRGQKPRIGVFFIPLVLKCRCPKWPRMSHLDICSLSYEQKKGRESNWQFDSRPLKVEN